MFNKNNNKFQKSYMRELKKNYDNRLTEVLMKDLVYF